MIQKNPREDRGSSGTGQLEPGLHAGSSCSPTSSLGWSLSPTLFPWIRDYRLLSPRQVGAGPFLPITPGDWPQCLGRQQTRETLNKPTGQCLAMSPFSTWHLSGLLSMTARPRTRTVRLVGAESCVLFTVSSSCSEWVVQGVGGGDTELRVLWPPLLSHWASRDESAHYH